MAILVLAASLFWAIGCSDDEKDDPEIGDFSGTWSGLFDYTDAGFTRIATVTIGQTNEIFSGSGTMSDSSMNFALTGRFSGSHFTVRYYDADDTNDYALGAGIVSNGTAIGSFTNYGGWFKGGVGNFYMTNMPAS
jgi:hypothetical protein